MTLQAASIAVLPNQLNSKPNIAGGKSGISTAGVDPPMAIDATYFIEGAGMHRKIGIDKIRVGNVGNLVADKFIVRYLDLPNGVMPFAMDFPDQSADTFPLVDTGRPEYSAGLGGDSVFRLSSNQITVADPDPDHSVGGRRRILSGDRPVWLWKINHPKGGQWDITSEIIQFQEFLVGYSSDFSQTYLAQDVAQWTLNLEGQSDSVDGTEWVRDPDDGKIVADYQFRSAVGQKLQVRGVTYVAATTEMKYVPQ